MKSKMYYTRWKTYNRLHKEGTEMFKRYVLFQNFHFITKTIFKNYSLRVSFFQLFLITFIKFNN